MRVEGQAAIVSGGASGLGRATAKALAASGVKVTILDTNEAAAAEAARERARDRNRRDRRRLGGSRLCGGARAARPGAHCRQLRRCRDRRAHRRTRRCDATSMSCGSPRRK